MKTIGFAQLRNELHKGNLENWFRCMTAICDYIYIYDQNSTDGSLEHYAMFDNTTVISSPVNRFKEEMVCKNELLNLIKKDHPDADWIFALDGDTLIDGRLLKNNGGAFREVFTPLVAEDYDAYVFGHKNLWRSDTYWRYDNSYDAVDGDGVIPIWKFTPNIQFESRAGLHISASPISIKTTRRLDYTLVHRGFSTDEQIMERYELYRSFGQSGYWLERFFIEDDMLVNRLDLELLPDWFEITDDTNPRTKRKLRDIYNEQKKG